jgi:hypothetical protein
MSMKWIASAFLCTGLAIACGGGGSGGGGSGLPEGDTIASLDASELEDLCSYFASLEDQPEREVDCGDGITVTRGINAEEVAATIAECVEDAPAGACPVTVGQAETCFEFGNGLTDEEFCDFIFSETPPAACAPLNDPACE